MKKIALLFMAITATVLTTSCGNDDDAGVASIQGNWKIVSEFEGGVNSNLMGCELDEEISFAASTGSYKVLDDDTVTPCTFDSIPFTHTLSGNNLSLTIDAGLFTLTAQAVIEELTSTTLRFRIISDSLDGVYLPQDVIVVTYTRI